MAGCRNHVRTAVFGMLVLALGMGLGRFLYTPILPVMLGEGVFSFDQLSYIASANYAGYLAGSLFFSFGILGNTHRSLSILLLAALSTAVLILLMAFFDNFYVVMAIRFLAGVASAAMMIYGSITVLQHTANPVVIASLYAGVGVGIFLGNEYVNIGTGMNLASADLWWRASVMSGVFFLLLAVLAPRSPAETDRALQKKSEPGAVNWWQLAFLYGLAGFGYIIVATYLPLLAKTFNQPVLSSHLWSLVGLGIIPGCYTWLWAGNRWGTVKCLIVNLVAQGLCVLLILLAQYPVILVVSCIGFGATFMGTTALVMPLSRRVSAPAGMNLVGLVTLTYGIGQILGPLLTSLLHISSRNVTPAIIYGAVALFCAAIICQVCLWKSKIE